MKNIIIFEPIDSICFRIKDSVFIYPANNNNFYSSFHYDVKQILKVYPHFKKEDFKTRIKQRFAFNTNRNSSVITKSQWELFLTHQVKKHHRSTSEYSTLIDIIQTHFKNPDSVCEVRGVING